MLETLPEVRLETTESSYDDEASSSKKLKLSPAKVFNLAITGCSHGEMDKIYETLASIERNRQIKFDLLICCGDFQAIRNRGDLAHMHVPPKYLQLMTFYKYYSGEKVAPVLTIFVGGNHESSGFMSELPFGGWTAPNIYYMGHASVVTIGPLRIAGLSGIYKGRDFHRGHFEKPSFNHNDIISAYHVRSVDVFRLKQLKNQNDDVNSKRLDAVVTHDWPSGITDFGDQDLLIRIKPHFYDDIMSGKLGNPATMDLLRELQPKRWFSAHLHVKFEAEVVHKEDEILENQKSTKFLALDKPLPRRKYLECLEVPVPDQQETNGKMDIEPFCLSYDPTWLAILKNTDHLTEISNKNVYMPGKTGTDSRYDFRPTKDEIEEIHRLFNGDFKIPLNFCRTAPPEQFPEDRKRVPSSQYYRNPQTMEFCKKLGIKDLNLMLCESGANVGTPYYLSELTNNLDKESVLKKPNCKNSDEIDIGAEDEFGDDFLVIDAPPLK